METAEEPNFYGSFVKCQTSNEYCDHPLDARAAAATGLEATDPGAALRAWTQIDRQVVDDAVTVPGVNWKDWVVHLRQSRQLPEHPDTWPGLQPTVGQLAATARSCVDPYARHCATSTQRSGTHSLPSARTDPGNRNVSDFACITVDPWTACMPAECGTFMARQSS